MNTTTNHEPRRGRRPSADPKDRRVTVRISQDDLQRLLDEAQRTGTSVGEVMRKLIRERLAATVAAASSEAA
jgi:predicted DNA binding CopG/RHH family protein